MKARATVTLLSKREHSNISTFSAVTAAKLFETRRNRKKIYYNLTAAPKKVNYVKRFFPSLLLCFLLFSSSEIWSPRAFICETLSVLASFLLSPFGCLILFFFFFFSCLKESLTCGTWKLINFCCFCFGWRLTLCVTVWFLAVKWQFYVLRNPFEQLQRLRSNQLSARRQPESTNEKQETHNING